MANQTIKRLFYELDRYKTAFKSWQGQQDRLWSYHAVLLLYWFRVFLRVVEDISGKRNLLGVDGQRRTLPSVYGYMPWQHERDVWFRPMRVECRNIIGGRGGGNRCERGLQRLARFDIPQPSARVRFGRYWCIDCTARDGFSDTSR